MDATARCTAVYWDVENIVARHYEAVHGKGTWVRHRSELTADRMQQRALMEAARIDAALLVRAAVPAGRISVSRAYGDWSRPCLRDLMCDLARLGVEMVQLPAVSGTKNGADVRLVVDAVDDLHERPETTDLVIVTGDADFSALVVRAQRAGKRVTTVASRSGCSRHLDQLSDQHLVYETMLPAPSATQKAVAALVRAAVTKLSELSDDGWVRGAALRPCMRQLDPGFEIPVGTSLREIIEPLLGVELEKRRGDHDQEFRLLPQGLAHEAA